MSPVMAYDRDTSLRSPVWVGMTPGFHVYKNYVIQKPVFQILLLLLLAAVFINRTTVGTSSYTSLPKYSHTFFPPGWNALISLSTCMWSSTIHTMLHPSLPKSSFIAAINSSGVECHVPWKFLMPFSIIISSPRAWFFQIFHNPSVAVHLENVCPFSYFVTVLQHVNTLFSH